jgi:hypothetical protein
MPRGIYEHKKGYKRPPISGEWRHNLSESHKGKLLGDENPSKRTDIREKISIAMRGNKNALGIKKTPEQIEKVASQIRGELNRQWKGESVSYRQLHKWLYSVKGKPINCVFCGKSEGRFEWANIDRKYRRNPEDFISLCKSCHVKYDRRKD